MWLGDCCYNVLCSRTIRKHLRQTSALDTYFLAKRVKGNCLILFFIGGRIIQHYPQFQNINLTGHIHFVSLSALHAARAVGQTWDPPLSSLTQTLSGTEEWPLGPSASQENGGDDELNIKYPKQNASKLQNVQFTLRHVMTCRNSILESGSW